MARVSSKPGFEIFWFRFEKLEIAHPVSYPEDENRRKFHHREGGKRDADKEYTESYRKDARICLWYYQVVHS